VLPFSHIPVLRDETLQGLALTPGRVYIDATLGGAGHALAMLAAQPGIQLLGFDQDPTALAVARQRLPETVTLIQAPFSTMAHHVPPASVTGGVLLDIGVSSPQLDDATRGFSFRQNAPLDMRMSQQGRTAAEWLASATEAELTACFKTYGEERLAKPIAQAIIASPVPMTHTVQLAGLISDMYRRFGLKKEDQHPATRVFQALRIQVNNELGELQAALDSLPTLLAPGARIAVITFHSLEDRMVKDWMRYQAAACVCPPRMPVCRCGKRVSLRLICKKPITASAEEIAANPRSRSAKLRVAEWL
jgi:16S rRNA (cytosine1402-N4)-methyltransferase